MPTKEKTAEKYKEVMALRCKMRNIEAQILVEIDKETQELKAA